MEESSESSYSPSIHSDPEDNPELEQSFISTRSCSQMSISSQGSSKAFADVPRKHIKGSGRKSRRFQLSSARKLRKPPTNRISATTTIPGAELQMPIPSSDTNILVNLATMQSYLNSMARCVVCEKGFLVISVTGHSYGTASFISIACNNCESERRFWSSGSRDRGRLTVGDNKIKTRSQLIYASVLSARIMGIGWAKLHLYHSFLNIPGPISKRNFTLVQADLLLVSKLVAEDSMRMAVNQLRAIHSIDSSSKYVEVVGTFDGAYQQRSGKSGGGFSRYCFAAAISAETGKVLSYGVACNSCAHCNALDNKLRDSQISPEEYEEKMVIHKPVCSAEYADYSSVQLESAIAPKVIGEALARGVIFTAIVSDGDNKTHAVLSKAGLYNDIRDAPTIDRFECIAHVAKRMKTNLHKRQDKILKTAKADKSAMSRDLTKKGLGKKEVSKKLDPLFKGKIQRSSKGRESWGSKPAEEIRHLTLALCGQIASYYRLAVQRNAGDVPSILAAIKAIPLHLSSTDENAHINHQYCPHASDSWCRYQQAMFNSESPPSHPNYLGADATDLIQNLFHEFGYDSEEFVTKISQGLSSNHNEAIHSLLFTMVHKTDAVGMDVMELGSALAVIRYNDGFAGIEKLCNKLCIDVNPRLVNAFESLDNSRARHKVHTIRDQRKRYQKKQRRGRKISKQLSKESAPYSSGKYSGAKSLFSSDSSSEEDMEAASPHATPTAAPAVSSFTDSSLDPCNICGGTEANGLVGIGLGLRMISTDIQWVQCSSCDLWYHYLCLNIEDTEEIVDEFYCPCC